MPRILALDHGKARCGVAVSDPTGTIARPLPIVRKPDSPGGLTQLQKVIREQNAELVVGGLPVGLSGRETGQTEAVRTFAKRLGMRLDVPIEFYDERFTTTLAQRDPDPRAAEDSRAAAHLLGSWLMAHSGPSTGDALDDAWENPAP